MKEHIVRFFETDRSYAGAVELYQKYGHMMSLKKQLNGQPESTLLKQTLFDQLRIQAGLDHKQFNLIMRTPVTDVKFNISAPAESSTEEIKTTGIPEVVKKTIKLRNEFKFLTFKNCPKELKILVADMITAYDEFKKSHKFLFTAENEQQILEASAGVVDNYLENQSIWEELNYYKENGKVLGKHPIFAMSSKLAIIKDMGLKELIKRKETLEKSISRLNIQLEENDKPELTDQRETSKKEKEFELVEILKEIEVRDKK